MTTGLDVYRELWTPTFTSFTRKGLVDMLSMQRRFQQMKKTSCGKVHGVLNTTTPKGLQNAVFYAIGKMFCLCGGQKHRALRLSQLQRDADKYVYYENVSKN